MKNIDPTEVLNDHIENLIDYLKRNIRSIGMVHGLSDSQISDMERDFIARLAFAAIIGDDEKEPEKEPEKESEKKTVPDEVWKALRFVKNKCNLNCDDCPFGSSAGIFCHLNCVPSDWKV